MQAQVLHSKRRYKFGKQCHCSVFTSISDFQKWPHLSLPTSNTAGWEGCLSYLFTSPAHCKYSSPSFVKRLPTPTNVYLASWKPNSFFADQARHCFRCSAELEHSEDSCFTASYCTTVMKDQIQNGTWNRASQLLRITEADTFFSCDFTPLISSS